MAAPTTSLPEQLGGQRNWDYRYTWIRDAAFSLYALLRLGFTEEAGAFMALAADRFRERAGRGDGPAADHVRHRRPGRPRGGDARPPRGLPRSAPVRIGNGAADQLQLDIYGELIDSVYLYNKYGEPISYDAWMDWSERDRLAVRELGSARRGHLGDARRPPELHLLAADVAGSRSSARSGWPGSAACPPTCVRWLEVRDKITEQIMTQGWNEERKAFVQHYDTDVLDASVLLMPLVKFIAPKDPRWLSTLDAIGNELVSDSLVYRYNAEASPDGLEGDEGTFSICSFWYVEALARAGRLDEARLAFEKMLTYANHLGLYSEEIGPPARRSATSPRRSPTSR